MMMILGSGRPRGNLLACLAMFVLSGLLVKCQLGCRYYDQTCPNLTSIARSRVLSAISNDTRKAASLRLHFHDCIINGYDGSVLLDDTSTMTGEKNAPPNKNALRGFDVINNI